MVTSERKFGIILAFAVCMINASILSPLACYSWLFTSIQSDVNATAVQTGWIGSIGFALNSLSSPLTVIVEGYVGYRLTIFVGIVFSAVSLFISSWMIGYGGVLLFCGVTYGIATNMPLHASMCVLFQHFTSSNRVRASSLSFLGQSVVSIFLGLSYQKLTPLIGWRNTLRITSLYVLALGLPLSFFVKLKSIDAADSNVGLGEQSVVQTPENQVVSSITDKYQTNERESENKAKEESEEKTKKKETAPRQLHSWLRFLKDYKVWCVAVAFYFPAMTWSVYWVNIVNFFESVGLHGDEILVNMTVSNVAEMLGKITLALFIHRLPTQEVNLLILHNICSSVVAAVFAFWPSKTILLIGSVFVGAGRGLYTVLPYVSAPRLLNKYHTDQAITLAIMSTGLGYAIGTIPAGAIYEATNSYFYAFVANATFCLFGAALLVLLQVHQYIAEKKSVR